MSSVVGGGAPRTLGIVILLFAAFYAGLGGIPQARADFTELPPIAIHGDAAFLPENGVVAGDGSESNPYVIAGWKIDVRDFSTTGIDIRDATRFFVVRDVYLFSTAAYGQSGGIGIYMNNVSHGHVQNVSMSGSYTGIFTEGADVVIESNYVSALWTGIGVSRSASFGIENNTVVRGSDFFLYGIAIGDAANGTISNNVVSSTTGSAIQASSSDLITIHGNEVSNSDSGIQLNGVTNATVTGNRLTNASFILTGLNVLHFSTHTITTDNLVDGLPVYYYRNCNDLTITSFQIGQLLVAGCSRISVTNLTTSGRMQMYFLDNSTVVNNRFVGRFGGISIHWSTNVSVFHNDFIHGAGPSQTDGSSAVWDDGYPNGGNYYSGLIGVDRCSGPNQDVCPDPDGIGDWGVSIYENGVDRYPLMVPYNSPAAPPVVSFVHDPGPIIAGIGLYFRSTSYDPDGTVVYFYWDFGDGGTSTYPSLDYDWHTFARPGTYVVTLNVTDNSGLMGSTSESIVVDAPAAASFVVAPIVPAVGETVAFDGSKSHSPYGDIVQYDWDFGDGTGGQGRETVHAFDAPGKYTVTLTARDRTGVVLRSSAPVLVLQFERFEHQTGFRLMIPTAWDRKVDQDLGGTKIELVLVGPSPTDRRVAILVDTEGDFGVRENSDYLNRLAYETIREIQAQESDASVQEAPRMLTVAGHRAVTFSLNYTARGLVQKAVVVVSEEHGRYWIILLTVASGDFAAMDSVMDRMVSSFEITAWPVRQALLAVGLVVASVVAAVIGAVLTLRRLRRKHAAQVQATRVPESLRCASCGAVNASPGQFCIMCGTILSAPPSQTPARTSR